jgi:hypothetical protein
MKKAKIMLTAITVLAVAGGALAFNAKKFSEFHAYQLSGSTCNTLTITGNLVGPADLSSATFSSVYVSEQAPTTTDVCSSRNGASRRKQRNRNGLNRRKQRPKRRKPQKTNEFRFCADLQFPVFR